MELVNWGGGPEGGGNLERRRKVDVTGQYIVA